MEVFVDWGEGEYQFLESKFQSLYQKAGGNRLRNLG